MSESYVVAVEGLDALADFQNITRGIETAARRAINRTLERTRTASARRMREQVNFPARYLSGSEGRLEMSKATAGNLEGTITGRARATSLSRFLTSGAVRTGRSSKSTISVEVAPGRRITLKRAFLLRLRAGNAPIETKSNLGIAIRLKDGERFANKKQMIQVSKGLYLLYGPSVDQVFRTVADEEAPEAASFLETEFLRIMDLGDLDG